MRLILVATLVLALAAVPHTASARFVQRWPSESTKARFMVRPVATEPIPEIEAVHRTIDEGRDAGQLDRRTSRRLRGQANQMASTARRYARDGMTPAERHELQVWAIVTKEQVDLLRAEMSVPGR